MTNAKQLDPVVLRLLTVDDARWICDLANNINVAKMVSRIPHPYDLDMAHEFLDVQAANQRTGDSHVFALVAGEPVGIIGFDIGQDGSAELGYWLGEPYWNRGYATQAIALMLDHAFRNTQVQRVWAGHFVDNPASGRVLEKNGFSYLQDDKLRPCVARGEDVMCRQMELYRGDWLTGRDD